MEKIMNSTGNAKTRDPYIIKYNGNYYHCFSSDGLSVSITCANSIEKLKDNTSKIVFVPSKNQYLKNFWAPELHIIDNKCYIYVACDDGNNYNHRMYVLENDSNDPMNEYKLHGKITDDTDKWAIDGNLILYNDNLYYFWSGWNDNRNVRQNIYVAKLLDPFTISTNRVMISTPEYEWEKIGCTSEDTEGKPYINEGPFAFIYNGELYLAYSASGSWDIGYCISFLKLNGSNPLIKENWYKYDKPVLSSNEFVKGAGHCCILNDNNKNYVFFHAWDKDCSNIVWSSVSIWKALLETQDGEFVIK